MFVFVLGVSAVFTVRNLRCVYTGVSGSDPETSYFELVNLAFVSGVQSGDRPELGRNLRPKTVLKHNGEISLTPI